MSKLPKTPSGESIDKVRRLLRQMDGSPKMRRAVAAAMKAMGLPKPHQVEDSKANQKARPPSMTRPAANG